MKKTISLAFFVILFLFSSAFLNGCISMFDIDKIDDSGVPYGYKQAISYIYTGGEPELSVRFDGLYCYIHYDVQSKEVLNEAIRFFEDGRVIKANVVSSTDKLKAGFPKESWFDYEYDDFGYYTLLSDNGISFTITYDQLYVEFWGHIHDNYIDLSSWSSNGNTSEDEEYVFYSFGEIEKEYR